MIARADAMSSARTNGGSSCARRRSCTASAVTSIAITLAPAFQKIDQYQHAQRQHEQHDRYGGGLAIAKLFQRGDDQYRRDLCLEWHVAGDKTYRAVLP